MMKQTIAALIVAGLAGTSGVTYAAPVEIESGVYTEVADCALLRDRVAVNISNGVTAVYNCLTAANKVNLGTCHASGSAKPTTITCATTGTDSNGDPTYNDDSCTNTTDTFTIQGRRGYTASTSGGSAGGTDLGATECTVAAVSALSGVTQ